MEDLETKEAVDPKEELYRHLAQEYETGNLKRITTDGYLVIGDKRTYLGEDFADFFAQKLDTNTWGLGKKVSAPYKTERGLFFSHLLKINDEGAHITPYSATEVVPQKPEEEAGEYSQRVRAIDSQRYIYFREKIKDKFAQELDFDLSKITLREQTNLINYIHLNGLAIFSSRIVPFFQNYGEKGLKTFLICEYDLELGDWVLEIGEALKPEEAEKIFSRYIELTQIAQEAETYIKNQGSRADPQKISWNLLSRAFRYLSQIKEDIKSGLEIKDILSRIEQIRGDLIAFAETYKESSGHLDELAGINFEVKDKLSNEEIEQMETIMRDNYQEKRLFLEKVVMPSFREALQDSKNLFYTIKKSDEIIAFFRLKREGDKIYFGSFNVNHNAQGARIGETMIREVLNRQNKTITANTEVTSPITQFYLSKLNFVAEEFLPNVAGTTTDGLTITLDKKTYNLYRRRQVACPCPIEDLNNYLVKGFERGQVLTYLSFDRQNNQYLVSFEDKINLQQRAELVA